MNSIGDRLKALRKAENLTQKEFSKRLLISQSYLSGLENGNEAPTNKLLKLVCLEFGVNEIWLADGNGEMYDEVYENDKAALVEMSNAALLKILNLLTTKSNVEYGIYANSIDVFAAMLGEGSFIDGDMKMKYLDLLQNLVMNLERMIYVTITNPPKVDLEPHRAEICKDMERVFLFIEELNNIHK